MAVRTEPGLPLSSREQEVASLAAAGQTSQQVATRLSLSVRTVDAHLRHIYLKTGTRNRAQLANWVHAQSGEETAAVSQGG